MCLKSVDSNFLSTDPNLHSSFLNVNLFENKGRWHPLESFELAIVPIKPEPSKVKRVKVNRHWNLFSPADLHIYWGTVYEGPKKPRSFNGQKGWHVYLFCRILFYVQRTWMFFRRHGTFGDALCIKILDRKLYAVHGIGTHV